MVAVNSTMLPLGTTAPHFQLLDTVSGNVLTLNELKSPAATVIMFICNHCPYVKHIQTAIVRLANEFQARGVSFIAINSNDAMAYPDDSPENMQRVAKELSYPFPYLYDESQEVAKVYQAACTPDFFVFDSQLKLVYRGQFDESRPGNNRPVNGHDLRQALDNLLNHRPMREDQKPSLGCNIKWRK